MWVFIKEIPPTTTNRALGQFLHKKINRNWVTQAFFQSELKQCSILRITDENTGTIECHGLAEIESLKPDSIMIAQLDGQSFLGKSVRVRKYYHRATCDSPRHQGTTNMVKEIKQGNRRRSNLRIEVIPDLIQGPCYANN